MEAKYYLAIRCVTDFRSIISCFSNRTWTRSVRVTILHGGNSYFNNFVFGQFDRCALSCILFFNWQIVDYSGNIICNKEIFWTGDWMLMSWLSYPFPLSSPDFRHFHG